MTIFSVLTQSTSAQPGSPSVGARYLIPTAATGADWAGKDGRIGIYTPNGWAFGVSPIGAILFIEDTGTYWSKNASGTWQEVIGPSPSTFAALSNSAITGVTTFRMFGFGALVTYTPSRTGKILIIARFRSLGTANSASSGDDYAIYYGAGSAPATNSAVSGTQGPFMDGGTPNGQSPVYPLSGIISGLAIGTTYWFDIAGLVGAGTSTMNIISGSITIVEL